MRMPRRHGSPLIGGRWAAADGSEGVDPTVSQRRGGCRWAPPSVIVADPATSKVCLSTQRRSTSLPGRHLTDHQVRLYMSLRREDTPISGSGQGVIQHRQRLPHRVRFHDHRLLKQTPRDQPPPRPAGRHLRERSGPVASRVAGSVRGDHLRRAVPPLSRAPGRRAAAPLSAACAGGAPCTAPNRR